MKILNKELKKIIVCIAAMLFALLIISLIGIIKFPWQQSFRVVFGSFYVLFLPGFVWSYVFFSKSRKEDKDEKPLDGIERVLLSFTLSLALSPLVLFFLNRIGLAINLLSSFLVILSIILIGLGIVMFRGCFIKNKKKEQ